MKLSKIVDKIKKYLKKDELKKSHEKNILNIIDDLKEKRINIKLELNELKKGSIERRIELQKKLAAISKLLKKSRSLL